MQVTTDGEPTGAVIIIQNDGPVLADADVVVLFDRFRRGGDATARGRSDGHGLGLSIARAVVTLSPVSIATRIPRRWSSATAPAELGFRVSAIAMTPAGVPSIVT